MLPERWKKDKTVLTLASDKGAKESPGPMLLRARLRSREGGEAFSTL